MENRTLSVGLQMTASSPDARAILTRSKAARSSFDLPTILSSLAVAGATVAYVQLAVPVNQPETVSVMVPGPRNMRGIEPDQVTASQDVGPLDASADRAVQQDLDPYIPPAAAFYLDLEILEVRTGTLLFSDEDLLAIEA